MASNRFSFETKTRVFASLACVTLALTMFALSSCGVLSSPERDETPSALALRAQYAYDKGNFAEAVELLEKVKKLDPSNINNLTKLAFSYLSQAGYSPAEIAKKATGLSGNVEIGSLMQLLTISPERIKEIRDSINVQSATAEDIREILEFGNLHKAFLALCSGFSGVTIEDIKTNSKSAESLIEIGNCGSGLPALDGGIALGGVFVALSQFLTLAEVTDFFDGDGKSIRLVSEVSRLQTQMGAASTLDAVRDNLSALDNLAKILKSDSFILLVSQIKIMNSVLVGSNLPNSVKAPLTEGIAKAVQQLEKVDEFLGQSSTTTPVAGSVSTEANKAAAKANEKLDEYIKEDTPAGEAKESCQKLLCMRKSYGLPTLQADMPTKCGEYYDSLDKTCSQ